MDADRLAALRAEAAHAEQRRDLYRQKSYGSRPTSPARMRELEREAEAAHERLHHAEAQRASDA